MLIRPQRLGNKNIRVNYEVHVGLSFILQELEQYFPITSSSFEKPYSEVCVTMP